MSKMQHYSTNSCLSNITLPGFDSVGWATGGSSSL